MKVLFVIPNVKELNSFPYFGNNGILSIASYLKNLGHYVLIEDRTLKSVSFQKLLKSFRPDILGVSFISCSVIDDAVKVSKLAQKNNIPVIWGGYGPIAYPEIILKESYVDFVSCGEGEYTFRDLLNAMSGNETFANIPGLAYRNKFGKIIVNPADSLIELKGLPCLDYSLINPSNYHFPFYSCKKMIYMYDGKGCPCQCKFCANKFFNECKSRSRNMTDVVCEINLLNDNYEFDGFFFTRELFAANKEELYYKCDELRGINNGIKWGAMLRCNMYSREDFEYMYKCGCRWLFFGVESASADVLKNMKKNTNISDAKQCISDCHEAGIMPFASFIFGYIGETEDDIKMTITFIKSIFAIAKTSYTFFSPAFCSESYNDLVDAGMIKKPDNIEEIGVSRQTRLTNNYSSVKTKDLRVIYYYFMLQSIFAKKIFPEKESNMFFECFSIFSKWLFKSGGKNFFKLLRYYLLFGKNLMVYTFMFPGIRKKYGLSLIMNKVKTMKKVHR